MGIPKGYGVPKMPKKLKRFLVLLILGIGLMGMEIRLFYQMRQLFSQNAQMASETAGFQERVEQVRGEIGKTREEIEKTRGALDALQRSQQSLEDGIKALRDRQDQANKRMAGVDKNMNTLNVATAEKIKGLSKTLDEERGKTKEWIMDSVKTMTILEDKINANQKDLEDALNNIGKRLDAIENQKKSFEQSALDLNTKIEKLEKHTEVLNKNVGGFKEELNQTKEKTLDIILKDRK